MLILTAFLSSQLIPSQAPSEARLNGTFIQLLEAHGSWTSSQWDQLFDWLRSVGINHLVVQWSVFDDLAFYPSTAFHSVENSPLETVLKLADSSHMSILVGLVHDAAYWSNIQGGPASVNSYLRKLRERSATAARELNPILGHYRSVDGWYIPQEIDDVNWRSPETRQLVLDHLGGLTRDLRRLNPAMTLAISTFSQAQSSPHGFEQFWDELFRCASIDAVLFQDGIGANKLEMNEVPIYLGALQNAVQKNSRKLRVVVELFRQVAGPPIDNSAFRAVPASLDRIRLQIELGAKFSRGGIIGFSVPEYMSPLGGEAGKDLWSRYKVLFGQKPNPRQ